MPKQIEYIYSVADIDFCLVNNWTTNIHNADFENCVEIYIA